MSQAGMLEQQAQAAATRYLKNVVIIDNELDFTGPDNPENPHFLDARKLTKSFSSKEITCSVLAPHELESSTDDAVDAAANEYASIVKTADVAVLDWQMSAEAEDPSRLCRAIIKKVVEQDRKGARPRLFIIYTGEKILIDLLNELKGDLTTIVECQIQEIPDVDFGIAINRLHIAFFSKSNFKDALNPSSLAPDEIPDKIINLFASHTKGILPSSIFNAIAILRETLPNLLSEFTADLDSAFVQHLMQIPDTDDGYAFLIELIKERITDPIFNDIFMHQFMQEQYLQEWKSSPQGVRSFHLTGNEYSQLLGFEISGEPLSNGDLNKLRVSTRCTCSNSELNRFTHLTVIKRDTSSPNIGTMFSGIFLGYGTVIRQDNNYYLCLLPKCDSVRLKQDFVHVPLLKLYGGREADKKPHVVLRDNEYIRLRYPSTKFWNEIVVVRFKVEQATKRIASTKNINDKLTFSEYTESTVSGAPAVAREFEWVADLKDSAMLAIHQKIFTNVSRMGSDEFEWLRRNQVVGNDCENCSVMSAALTEGSS
jgi:hypothetical protein